MFDWMVKKFHGSVAERVERGMALLDEAQPGWWQSINLDRLNIARADACVLGQTYGDYGIGRITLGVYDTAGHGFQASHFPTVDLDAEFRALTHEWARQIEPRQAEWRAEVAAKAEAQRKSWLDRVKVKAGARMNRW